MSSLAPEAYAAIEGRHSDPFRYLGPAWPFCELLADTGAPPADERRLAC
jgi:hypothetical protein